jgi:hypothetical protein
MHASELLSDALRKRGLIVAEVATSVSVLGTSMRATARISTPPLPPFYLRLITAQEIGTVGSCSTPFTCPMERRNGRNGIASLIRVVVYGTFKHAACLVIRPRCLFILGQSDRTNAAILELSFFLRHACRSCSDGVRGKAMAVCGN